MSKHLKKDSFQDLKDPERDPNKNSEDTDLDLEDLDELLDLSEPHISRSEITEIIDMKPTNLFNYRRAFVHKSIQKHVRYSEGHGLPVQDYMKESYERLEFLGDAVLNLVTANLLFHKYPDRDEGFMTRLRTKIIRGSNCVLFAKTLNLGRYALVSNKLVRFKDQNGHIINDSILEDIFEALIGAIYIDLGFKHAEVFILKLISKEVNFDKLTTVDDNYKDILMRYSQSFSYELPIYTVLSIDNLSNAKRFNVSISLKKPGPNQEPRTYGVGSGRTKQEAEQNACKNAICDKYIKEHSKTDHCKKIHMDQMAQIINRSKNIQ
jgi:ribonuclease III